MSKRFFIGGLALSVGLMVSPLGARASDGGSDVGANYTASNPWVNGSNGGTGFNPWAFNGTTQANAIIADASTIGSSPINLGPTSFDLTAPSDYSVSTNFFAFRGFAGGALTGGQTFSASEEVNFRDGLKGLSVLDSNAVNVAGVAVESGDYYFRVPGSTGTSGSNPDLLLSSVGTGNWGYDPDTILTLSAESVGNDLQVVVTRSGGATASYSTTLAGYGADAFQMNIYSFGASAFPAEQIFYNNLNITSATPEPSSLVCVAIGALGLMRQRRRVQQAS